MVDSTLLLPMSTIVDMLQVKVQSTTVSPSWGWAYCTLYEESSGGVAPLYKESKLGGWSIVSGVPSCRVDSWSTLQSPWKLSILGPLCEQPSRGLSDPTAWRAKLGGLIHWVRGGHTAWGVHAHHGSSHCVGSPSWGMGLLCKQSRLQGGSSVKKFSHCVRVQVEEYNTLETTPGSGFS